MLDTYRGLLAVFGAFLIQLCLGCYHGTFGNILPYLTSYMKQVKCGKRYFDLFNNSVQPGCDPRRPGDDFLYWWPGSGSQLLAGFVSHLMTVHHHSSLQYIPGGLILVPLLGSRRSLMFGCFLFSLAPLLTYFSLDVSVSVISCTYGLLNGFAVNVIQLGTESLSLSYECSL